MKRHFLLSFGIIFLLIGLISCKEKLTGMVVNSFEDGFPQKILYYSIKNGDSILTKQTEYHPNHSVFIEGSYKNGKRDGKWKSWYDNGTLWSIGYFQDGIQVKETKTYYENGELRYSGQYDKGGNRTGKWNFYDEKGNPTEEIVY